MDFESTYGIFFLDDTKEALYNMMGEAFKGFQDDLFPKKSSTNAAETGQRCLKMESHSR
jgi:hypothetical protein